MNEGLYKCVLDTNVIYPLEIRDLLFWFAFSDMYVPKWSKHIFDEWESVMERKGIPENEIIKRTARANLAFPDAFVKKYESIIPSLNLPDLKDRHVLAAAIKSESDIIVTNNIKDFPEKYLAKFEIKAVTADDFLSHLFDLYCEQATSAFKQMVFNRRNPNLDEAQLIEILNNRGLVKISTKLAKALL